MNGEIPSMESYSGSPSHSSSESEDLSSKPTLKEEEQEKGQVDVQGRLIRFVPRSVDRSDDRGGRLSDIAGDGTSDSASSTPRTPAASYQKNKKKEAVLKEDRGNPGGLSSTETKSWGWGNPSPTDQMEQYNQFVTGPQVAVEIDMEDDPIDIAMAGGMNKNGGRGTSQNMVSSTEGNFRELGSGLKKKGGRKGPQMPEIPENGSRSGSQGESSSALQEVQGFPPLGYGAQVMAMGGVAGSGINSAGSPLNARMVMKREKETEKAKAKAKEREREKEERGDASSDSEQDAIDAASRHVMLPTLKSSGSMYDECPISKPQRQAQHRPSQSINEIGRLDADEEEEEALALSDSKVRDLANNRMSELEIGKMEGGVDSSGQEKGLNMRKGGKGRPGRDGVGTSGESRKKPGRNLNAAGMEQSLGPEKDPSITVSRQSSGSNQGSIHPECWSSFGSYVELEVPSVETDTDSSAHCRNPVKKGKPKGRNGKGPALCTTSEALPVETDINSSTPCRNPVKKGKPKDGKGKGPGMTPDPPVETDTDTSTPSHNPVKKGKLKDGKGKGPGPSMTPDPPVETDTDSSTPSHNPVKKSKVNDGKGKGPGASTTSEGKKKSDGHINTHSPRTGTEADMISYNYSCAEMVRKFALHYWKLVLTHEERKKARKDMKKLDQDGDGSITLNDLLHATHKKQHRTIKKMFTFLDQDQSGFLGLEECITLYYLKQTGYRICGTCYNPILNTGFTCKTCWELSSHNQSETFDLCVDCYTSGNYDHDHQDFLDDLVMRLQTASIAASAITVVQCIICGHYHDKKARGFLLKKEKHMLKLAIRSSGEVVDSYVCEWCLLWSCNNCGKYFTSSLANARPRLFLTKEYNCDECEKSGSSGHLKFIIESIEDDMRLRNACSTCDTLIRNGDLFNFSSKSKKGIVIPDALKKLGSTVKKTVQSSGIADINMGVGYGTDKDKCGLM